VTFAEFLWLLQAWLVDHDNDGPVKELCVDKGLDQTVPSVASDLSKVKGLLVFPADFGLHPPQSVIQLSNIALRIDASG
jgi:hypothetical protein